MGRLQFMKIFISHQQTDTALATWIAKRLWIYHTIDSYLDVVDPESSKKGDQLGEHLQDELDKCDQLLAVVSQATKGSWWVPWEIGVATEKDYPIATYASDETSLPEYLKRWPYLRSQQELDIYARIAKTAHETYVNNKRYMTEDVARKSGRRLFYRQLRQLLGQI
ncbi:MAG: TIR domain-containing protein [Mesorhizobium sp.]|nr:MAG: TIR domain-containing protein [Mesorhizobium sp.]TIR48888.1 MAG: TIR domain-containing protein [Mesorhizobium sp.]TJV96739.1 MAG: TIR domain-containing protein [Mesorhizobium sp.]